MRPLLLIIVVHEFVKFVSVATTLPLIHVMVFEYTTVADGTVLLIRPTVAVRLVLFHAISLMVKTNEPLPVNVYPDAPPLLTIVIASLGLVIVAVTLLRVGEVMLYWIFAVGAIVSILLTTADTLPVNPA